MISNNRPEISSEIFEIQGRIGINLEATCDGRNPSNKSRKAKLGGLWISFVKLNQKILTPRQPPHSQLGRDGHAAQLRMHQFFQRTVAKICKFSKESRALQSKKKSNGEALDFQRQPPEKPQSYRT
ncbi:hypothetical protein ACOSQ3_005173 [Xanthoceras sorbifolium]